MHKRPSGERDQTRSSTGFVAALATTVGCGIVFAAPAGAISSITNTIWLSRTSLSPGQTVTIKGDTTFGSSSFLPNPYTSNFRNAIDALHFNRPSIYSENCEGSAYYFTSSDGWTLGDPSYRFDCGTFVAWPTTSRHVYSTATTNSSGVGTGTRTHQQGEYDASFGGIASGGPADYWNTTFSAK